MDSLRLRYEDGRFVPLDPIPEMEEGAEIDVLSWTYATSDEALDAVLDRTRGLWADWDGIEDLLADARDKWEQAWRSSQSSS
jgi:hypothetical protein